MALAAIDPLTLRPECLSDGIELTPVEVLLKAHQHTIERLIDCIAPETAALHDAIQRTLEEFTAWVHQLPASEAHHHSYRGGLLEHSLEVALWSAESARSRLGDLKRPGWERRRQERTFVLAVALSGLLHDLGKPVADLLIFDPLGQTAWNPYRGSLVAWAESEHLSHYHLQWLRGRGTRHQGFSLLMLRSVVEPTLFDRLREVGPELEARLLDALTAASPEEDPVGRLVSLADQESTLRSLKDPRRQAHFGGPTPENVLIHTMRHLVHQGIWQANVPGNALWYLEDQLYLSWPRAVSDMQQLIDRDRFSGIPLEPDLLLMFLEDRGLLAPIDRDGDIPTPIQTLQPEILDVPIRLIKLRSPRLFFDGVLPDSMRLRTDDSSDVKVMVAAPIVDSEDLEDSLGCLSEAVVNDATHPSLKTAIQAVSDRFEWRVLDHHLFLPHPETAKALGMEPLELIDSLDQSAWLEPGGAGHVRKVRVVEGRRGLLLTRIVSHELLKAMKVPQRKSRRKLEISA